MVARGHGFKVVGNCSVGFQGKCTKNVEMFELTLEHLRRLWIERPKLSNAHITPAD